MDKFEGCGGWHYLSSAATYCLATKETKTRTNKLA